MTSLAFIGGMIPLVVGSGAGSASRHSLGTAVFTGILSATLLEIFFIPVFYVLIGRIVGKLQRAPASTPAPASAAPETGRA